MNNSKLIGTLKCDPNILMDKFHSSPPYIINAGGDVVTVCSDNKQDDYSVFYIYGNDKSSIHHLEQELNLPNAKFSSLKFF